MGFIGIFLIFSIVYFLLFLVVAAFIGIIIIAILVATMSLSVGAATSILVKDQAIKKMTILLSVNTFLLSSTFFLPIILGKLGASVSLVGICVTLGNMIVVGISLRAFKQLKEVNHKGLRIGGYILFGLTLGIGLFLLVMIAVIALLMK